MKKIIEFYSVPKNFFILILLLQAAFWTAVPYFTLRLLPLDTLEAVVWSQDWAWGNAKHPPLTGWLTAIFGQPGDDVFFYLLSQLLVVVALGFAYLLAREFLPRTQSIVAALSLTFITYYNFSTPEFNVNKPQIALWPVAAYFFVRAARRNSWKSWIAFGVAAGLCILTKYYCALLFFALAAWLATTPSARKSLKTPWPYLAALIAALIALPHVLWLIDNHFLPFEYAQGRMTNSDKPWWFLRFVAPVVYAAAQIGLLAVPAALTVLPFWKSGVLRVSNRREHNDSFRLALFLMGAPLALQCLIMLVFKVGARTMWCEPVFFSFGLLFMSFAGKEEIPQRVMRRFEAVVLIIFILQLAVFAGASLFRTSKRRHLPAREAASAIMANSRAVLGPGAKPDVVGTPWTAGIMLRYLKDPPRAAIHSDPTLMRKLGDSGTRGRLYIMDSERKMRECLAGRDDLMIYELETYCRAPFGKTKSVGLFYAIDPPKLE